MKEIQKNRGGLIQSSIHPGRGIIGGLVQSSVGSGGNLLATDFYTGNGLYKRWKHQAGIPVISDAPTSGGALDRRAAIEKRLAEIREASRAAEKTRFAKMMDEYQAERATASAGPETSATSAPTSGGSALPMAYYPFERTARRKKVGRGASTKKKK
jgi:hypothetical protein